MRYIDRLTAVNQAAADQMQAYIQRNGFGNTEQIISMAAALADKYGEAAAAATCDMYDAVAAAQGVSVPPAEPARTPSLQEVKDVIEYALDQAPTTVPAKTGALVKKTSTRTMRKNAARDGAKMALIPSGDGCAFCKMLGSRGWEDARSSKSFEAHLHAHCRCEYVVRFSDNLEVEGYDPDALYEEYLAGGDSSRERMNAMRRTYRSDHKDEINAQKRAAYAAKNKKELLLIEAVNPFKTPKTPLEIDSYNQSKHIEGGARYVEYMKTHEYEPSMLIITEEEAQKLIEKYHGTGILRLDKDGEIIPQEMIIDNDQIIGFAVNNRNGKRTEATGFKIHYSERGTHIVPMYENQKEYWKERRRENGHDWLLRQKG